MRIDVVIMSFVTCLSLTVQQAAAQEAASADALLVGVGAKVAQDAAESADEVAYRFGSGDKLRIRVYNEDTISGDYEVDSTGNLSLQLLGQVKAVGLTLTQLTALIERRLREEGYMISPKVAIDVLNYRPFYVLGEVGKPGSYPYVAGMTVLNAIALAGGYTYRAKQSKFELIRGPDNKKVSVDVNSTVLPGDIIKVNERFF